MVAADSGGYAARESPTVSKDKVLRLTLDRLRRGWIIVIGPKGKNANLFKPGSGFTPILFSVAGRLRELGLIVEDGKHVNGTRYVLANGIDPQQAVEPILHTNTDDDTDEEDSDSAYDDVDTLSDIEDEYESEDNDTGAEDADEGR